LERVEVNIINGSDIQTSGIDVYAQYTFEELLGGEFTFGVQGTKTIEYDSQDFKDINGFTLAPGGDFVGFLNDLTAPFTPKPELKGDVFAKFTSGIHTGTLVMRYVSDYEDAAPPGCAPVNDSTCLGLDEIDDQTTFDAHYIVRLMNDSLTLAFSAINFTDEEPPIAATDLNYDPFTHDGRGRIFKAGITYAFGQQ
jgi:outer membrane receptor protein involved in Fe transport